MKTLYALMATSLIGFALSAQDAAAGTFCTADVFQCPDGSVVERDPANNCEFFECPACINPETGQPAQPVVCIQDPCAISACDAAPNALCTPNFCGGCFAIYTDEGGGVIDCDDVCLLPTEVGPCDAVVPRWTYDSSAGECVQFTYGGCEGTDNNFLTQEDCEAVCDAPPPHVPHIPHVPAVSNASKILMIGFFVTGLVSLSYFAGPLRRRG